jgi:transposase-like protein
MYKEAREELRVRLKLVVFELANHFRVTKACREFNVPQSTFYRWKQNHDIEGRSDLYRKRRLSLDIT